MKKRQIIIILVGLAILAIGKLSMDYLADKKESQNTSPENKPVTVFTSQVQLSEIPIYIYSSGVLQAVNRIDLFSEVQGIMEADIGRFKAGNSFRKGETLLQIRSKDQEAQFMAQRAGFQSALTAIMPDIKADFPDAFATWNAYLSKFDASKSVPELPEANTPGLKSFLVGRGILNNYHLLKNIEVINSKYTLKAPFDGVLTASNVTPGSLIRPGQALGTFIQPTHFELETAVDALNAEKLSIGQKVELSLEGLPNKAWKGTIARIVKSIDKNSQLSSFYVSVKGADLKEGMFLKAKVTAREIKNGFEISRAAIVNKDEVYLVVDNQLKRKQVKIEHYHTNTVILSGLEQDDLVLTTVPLSAFDGMEVTVYQEK